MLRSTKFIIKQMASKGVIGAIIATPMVVTNSGDTIT